MSTDNGVWKFPANVPGWLSEAEGRRLSEVARGKRVLEIGAFMGRSTISMAQTARVVEVIDPLDGRATPSPGDTSEGLLANLDSYGVRERVRIHAGTTEEVAPALRGPYDLIFIDGDHSRAALEVDITAALRLLAPGGLLAFHDYSSPVDPQVTIAVNELVNSGARVESITDTLAVIRPAKTRKAPRPVVVLSMPRRGENVSFGACEGYHLYPSNGACEVVRSYTISTVLDHAFNRLWAVALNLREKGATHFAMQHDDVAPCQGWLDILMAELVRTGADVVSAVVPIKSEAGLTSTAVETDDDYFPRRLTMKEVHDLPETFADEDVGGELLLNTGLWVCDIRRPWVDTPSPLVFHTVNRIVLDDEGQWQAQAKSEDWEFSRAARARGARLLATRKVALHHAGEMRFTNSTVWGEWQTDEVYRKRLREAAEACAAPVNPREPQPAEGACATPCPT